MGSLAPRSLPRGWHCGHHQTALAGVGQLQWKQQRMFQISPGALESLGLALFPQETPSNSDLRRPLLKQNGKKRVLGRTHWLQMTDPYSDLGKGIQLQAQVYPLINPLKDPSVSRFFSLLLLACQHHSYRLSVPTRLEPRAALGSNSTLERKMNSSPSAAHRKIARKDPDSSGLGLTSMPGPTTAAR